MRASIAFVLPLVALGGANPLERRQNPLASILGNNMAKQKAMKIEDIKPLLRPDAKRIRMTYGPYKLKAANSKERPGNGFSMDPAGTGYSYAADSDFPRDITVLETKALLVNETFQPAEISEGIYNHHIAWFEHNQTPVAFYQCADRPAQARMGMTVFIGGTTEDLSTTYWNEKLNTGLYIGKDDRISMMLDFVNYNDVPRTVYTIEEIEFLPGKLKDLMSTTQVILDPAACGGMTGTNIHNMPANHANKKFQYSGKDIKISRDGYFFNIRAHLHDGGDKITAKVNGKQVCESKAVYGGQGRVGKDVDGKEWSTISSTTMCDVIPVKKGDTLSLEAFYDMEAHPPRKQSHGGEAEVMALFGGHFAISP